MPKTKKHKSCIRKVKKNSPNVNAYAVCNKAMKKGKKHGR